MNDDREYPGGIDAGDDVIHEDAGRVMHFAVEVASDRQLDDVADPFQDEAKKNELDSVRRDCKSRHHEVAGDFVEYVMLRIAFVPISLRPRGEKIV